MVISIRPTLELLGKSFGLRCPDLEAAAVERWDIAPSDTCHVKPALFLGGQFDKIRGTEFATIADVMRDFRGGFDAGQEKTIGFRLKDVDLVDGVVYGQGVARHLRKRIRRSFAFRPPDVHRTGVLFESWVGNRWFGNWLSDDCLTYRLAEKSGCPFTTRLVSTGHVPRYEELLGMSPLRIDRAHFEELVIFRDWSHNANKKARANQVRAKLTSNARFASHPGVFVLRGSSGMKRVLANEQAIAEALAGKLGFSIINPETSSVDDIIATCAGARVVAGVEGSHLVHGLMSMPPTGTLLVIQPPHRVTSVLKMITDRQEQSFAFVVGDGASNHFWVQWDDVIRTLDLAIG